MVRWTVVLMLLAGTGANAQTVMDGSEKLVSAEVFSKLKGLLNKELSDPYGAQLQNLRMISPDRVCGAINIKNYYGGMTGFRMFGLALSSNKLSIFPDITSIDTESQKTVEKIEETKSLLKDRLDQMLAVKAICDP